jgi:diphthine synthase
MSELLFVGAGLFDEMDLSRRAVEALRGCGAVFAEEYTAVLAPGTFDRLSATLGRPIERLGRAEVESGTPVLEALAEHARVGFVVPGDPFAATTHVALRLAAEEHGHHWRYLPGASILTAASGLLGLQPYRFGRVVSLPFPAPGFAPTSPLEMIAANRSGGLHTLVLLDLRPEEGRFLTGRQAVRLLQDRDPEGRWLPREAELAIVARAGAPTATAAFGPAATLQTMELGPPLHCLVVPAPELHFEEAQAIRRWRVPG